MSNSCHCGDPRGYEGCCAPIHRGDHAAATAEALMRARYSAYVEHDEEFLRRSWHPGTCPADLARLPDAEWLGLSITEVTKGGQLDGDGSVSFVARLRTPVGQTELVETSVFTRVNGRWVYLEAAAG